MCYDIKTISSEKRIMYKELYQKWLASEKLSDVEKKELQEITNYKSRSQFLKDIINPLMEEGVIYRDGNVKSPKALIRLKN